MKKIAVLTSGGDAQGMNAAIYGIFGRAQELGYELYGIRNGYAGLLREDIVNFTEKMCGILLQKAERFWELPVVMSSKNFPCRRKLQTSAENMGSVISL